MKTKALIAAVATLALFAPTAHADQKNIDIAIGDAVRTYKDGGTDALLDASHTCYPATNRYANNGDKVDYCVAYDIAANKILQNVGAPIPEYFKGITMLMRQTGAAEHAHLFVGPDGLLKYMDARINYVQPKVPKRL
ncbi:hypothetical protein PQR05_29505 [Paraburkholderia sediminicola]|uniref:hypothetical protein n=1 Tax=Paraburkholderia sediminicola TaxID=458836 RepID=UPI0038B6D1F1